MGSNLRNLRNLDPRSPIFSSTLTLHPRGIVGTKIVGTFEEHRGFKFNQIYKLVNLDPRSTHFYPTLKPRGHYRNPTSWKTLHKHEDIGYHEKALYQCTQSSKDLYGILRRAMRSNKMREILATSGFPRLAVDGVGEMPAPQRVVLVFRPRRDPINEQSFQVVPALASVITMKMPFNTTPR